MGLYIGDNKTDLWTLTPGPVSSLIQYYLTFDITRMSISRLTTVTRQLQITPQARLFASTATEKMNINTKYKMLSGHEIPALGYGVCMMKSESCRKRAGSLAFRNVADVFQGLSNVYLQIQHAMKVLSDNVQAREPSRECCFTCVQDGLPPCRYAFIFTRLPACDNY